MALKRVLVKMTRDYCFSYGKNTQKNPHYWAIVTCFVQTGTLRLQSCANSRKLLTGEVYNTYIISGFSNVTIPDKTQKWEAILRTKTEKECVFQRQKLIEKNSFLYSIIHCKVFVTMKSLTGRTSPNIYEIISNQV